MLCSCGDWVRGTLITYYHDGGGIIYLTQVCEDCGGKLHNPFPKQPYGREDSDFNPRPQAFFLNEYWRNRDSVPRLYHCPDDIFER